MKNIISIVLLALTATAFAQAPTIQWAKSFGGSSDEFSNSSQQTTDGGYIAAGYSSSNDGQVTGFHGLRDFWVVKMDNLGTLQWQQCYGGTSDDEALCIRETSDGGYIVAGNSKSNNGDVSGHHGLTNTNDFWVVKLNSTGIIQWQKSLGGTDEDIATAIEETNDGGFIVTGFTQSTDGDIISNHGNADYWVVKLSSTGNMLWQNCYGGTAWDDAFFIEETSDNGFIISGSSDSNDGDVTGNHGLFDYWLVKINSTGILQWQKSYGGTGDDQCTEARQTSDHGFISCGFTGSSDGDVIQHYAPTEFWIVKSDSLGNLQWALPYGGQGSDVGNSVEETSDGGYIVAGGTSSNTFDVTGNHGVNDCWLLKLSNAGIVQWENCFGGNWDDGANSVHETSDGGYIFSGWSMLNGGDVTGNHGAHDFWIVKLNGADGINELAKTKNISAFPNPATDEITIFSTFVMMRENYSIIDQNGKIVLTGRIGDETTTIPLENLADGNYIIQVGDETTQFVKMH